MAIPTANLLLLIDQLQDCYFEQLALTTVLIAYEGSELPLWPEVQLLVAEAKRSIVEREQEMQEPFAVLRKQVLADPNLERAIQTILRALPARAKPN